MSTETDIKVFNSFRRLRQIKRCNTMITLLPEDVAQHSFYTALIVHQLVVAYNNAVDKNNQNFHPLDDENNRPYAKVDTCIQKALYHDLEEVYIGDIPWSVKHYSSFTHAGIQECKTNKLNNLFEDCTTQQLKTCKQLMLTAKDDIEGELVDLADLLEGAWYCLEEIGMGNNKLSVLLAKYLELIQLSPIHQFIMDSKDQFYTEFMEYLTTYNKECIVDKLDSYLI